MSTTPQRSTSVFSHSGVIAMALLAAMLLTAEAQAQQAQRGTRLEWPRTFGGQPDFEFARVDVIKEAQEAATKQGLPEPAFPTMADLLEDTTLSPLMLEDISVTEEVSATQDAAEVSGTTAKSATLSDILPSMSQNDSVNLTEFRSLLTNALAQQVKSYRLGDNMDASYLLRQLKLQAVVRSPVAYATINETRYKIGDTLTLPLMAGPSDLAQLALLEGLLPPESSMTPEASAQYRDVMEDVVKELAAKKNSSPATYQKVFDMPVTLLEIQPRTVIVQFQGQQHELKIPYLY